MGLFWGCLQQPLRGCFGTVFGTVSGQFSGLFLDENKGLKLALVLGQNLDYEACLFKFKFITKVVMK
jgi:hypothetical protein